MKTSKLAAFGSSWLRYFLRGLHALVAIMISGFISQLATWAVISLISIIFGSDAMLHESFTKMVILYVCFGLVGLPLFGFLFSNAFSLTEPTVEKE